MMTKDQIKYTLDTKEHKLDTWGKLTHYSPVLFLFIIPAVFVFILHLTNNLEGTPLQFKQAGKWFMFIPALLGIIAFRTQRQRLKFKSIATRLTRDEIDPIIEKVARELEWHFHIVEEKFIVAKTHPGFISGSWGEQITILFDSNQVLVNSICDPDKQRSIVAMGRNIQNEKKLIEEIKKANG